MRFFFFFLHALPPLYQNFESQSGITIHKGSHIHSHSSFLSLFNEVSSLVYTTGVLIHILFLSIFYDVINQTRPGAIQKKREGKKNCSA